jgi:hypothetical protein
MGTRSLTFVYDSYKDEAGKIVQEPIINMYRQYDGYPTGHGAELAEFLAPFTLVNGLGINETRKVANGMGCLAAQLVSNFKDGAGGFYLYPTSAVDCGQDYEYHIFDNVLTFLDEDGIERRTKELRIAITNRGCNFFGLTQSDTNESIFEGSLAEFIEFCTEKEEA